MGDRRISRRKNTSRCKICANNKELKERGERFYQNGRVERSHRKDQERFYYNRIFYSLEDLRAQGKEWRKEYNNFPMRSLGWLSRGNS